MPSEGTAVASASLADRVKILSLKARLLTLDHLDKRSSAFRRVNEIVTDLSNDLGGADLISTAQRQLIERAAITIAVIADVESRWLAGTAPIDPMAYTTLTNGLRRLLQTLGLERRAKPVPTIEEHMARMMRERPLAPEADDEAEECVTLVSGPSDQDDQAKQADPSHSREDVPTADEVAERESDAA